MINAGSVRTLATAYMGIALAYGALFLHDFPAHIRAALIFLFTLPVVVAHIRIFNIATEFWSKRYFVAISLLWVCKLTVFSLNEGLHYFSVGLLALDWLDLFLLLGISTLVSISFLMRAPFFYQPVRRKTVVLLGIGGLIMSASMAVMVALSIKDLLMGIPMK